MAKKSGKSVTVKWVGAAGIEQALRLKAELIAAFDLNNSVSLDLSGAEEIDLSALQIIIAADKEAGAQKKSFFLENSIPPAISEFALLCGVKLESFLKQEDKNA